jgi:hypothetical protein
MYWTYSCDDRTTFSTPARLSDQRSNTRIGIRTTYGTNEIKHFGWPAAVSTDANVAAAWTDSRNGTTEANQETTNRQDIFFAARDAPSCAGRPPGPDRGQPPTPPPAPPGGGGGPSPGPGPGGDSPARGPRPGVAGPRCGDATRPRSSVSKRSRLTRTRVLLSGRTTDRECSPEGRVIRTKRKLARVEVSVATRKGKQCRFVTFQGTLSSPRSCARPVWLRATTVSFDAKKAKTAWKLARAVKVPAGRYNVIVRGVDRDRNLEVKKLRSNRAKLRAR